MQLSRLAVLLAAHSAVAQWQKLLPNAGLGAVTDLLVRQDGACTIHSTCAECYGDGNVICDKIGCFNPDKHEQCCNGAYVCVGRDASCCDSLGGSGVTGTSGVPDVTASATAAPPDVSSWTCTKDDSGEECCQRGSSAFHWCSGDYPTQNCYNPSQQSCCTDGSVCSGDDCCELFSASTTDPYTAKATMTSSSSAGQATTGSATQSATASSSAPQSTATSAALITRSNLRIVGVVASGIGFVLSL